MFFDIGGVVVKAPMDGFLDLGTDIFECDREVLSNAAAQILPALETGKIQSEEFWQRLSEAISSGGHGKAVPAWKFKGFWEGLMTDSLTVDEGLIGLVRRLKAQIRVAAFSNVIKEHAVILQREKVYEHFNPVILSCKIGARKPDPEAFAKAAELAKTAPGRCMLVDDCPINIQAAEKAGFRTFHYTGLDEFRRELYEMGFFDTPA